VNDLPQHLSVEQKRQLLAELLRQEGEPLSGEGPLSHGQRALWFVYQLDPQSSAYNILYAASVREDVDRSALARAFQRLIDRHAALRTTCGAEEGVPVARVQSRQACPLETTDASGWSDAELHERIHAQADVPFDLELGPVIRARLFVRIGRPQVLLVTAVHMALDFWSLDLMFDELQALYAEEVSGTPSGLRPVKVQYADFVRWQEEMLAGAEGERLWEYWREQLAGELPALDLPTDRPRPPVQTYRGATLRFNLPDDLCRRLTALAKAEGATLYMIVLAAFQVLLHRWSHQGEILVGSSTAGRNRAEWEEAVGYFLNVIVLRGRIAGEMTFQEFLAQVRETVLGALGHQDYPFPLLVERLAPRRDISRSPVFQVAFNWDRPRKLLPTADGAVAAAPNGDASPADPASLELRPFLLGQQGAAFDLTLVMLHLGETLSGAVQYNSDLFDRAAIERFASQFRTLLEGIAANPRQPVAELPLLTRAERQMLLEDWNDTAAEYPRHACLHEIVVAQAARTPDRVAVAHGGRSLTYRQLDEQSTSSRGSWRTSASALTCWWACTSTARRRCWWACWACSRRAARTCRSRSARPRSGCSTCSTSAAPPSCSPGAPSQVVCRSTAHGSFTWTPTGPKSRGTIPHRLRDARGRATSPMSSSPPARRANPRACRSSTRRW
jgi:hypothetical protein